VQRLGSRAYLWAGAAAEGDVPGEGCWRWELRGTQFPPDGWNTPGTGWIGGSCLGLAFQGTKVYAASRRAGVLRLESANGNPAWQPSDITRSGLPTEQVTTTGRVNNQFQRIESVAAMTGAPAAATAANQPGNGPVVAGGPMGVYISYDGGDTYSPARSRAAADTVTLPSNWLFVSGEHDIQVISDNETT
jgi:hypothetical protein